ncbi:MAG: right-handed parallel beta-helix repeat-containing protein, partial [Pseudomonadota bacterium]
ALTGAPPAASLIRAGGSPGEPLALPGCRGKALREAIDWALEPEASDRPQSMAEWRARLKPALAAASEEAKPADAPPSTGQMNGMPTSDPDYPPTIRVARVRRSSIPTKAQTSPVAPASDGRGRGGMLRGLLALVLLAGIAAVAATYGWPLYERYVKREWLVDQAGGGDATTIGDALARARDDAVITIGPGTYRESLRIDRPATLIAQEGAAPIIAPEDGSCVTASSRGGSITGLQLQVAPLADPAPGFDLAGSALNLEGNRITGAAGTAIRIRDGADPVVRGNQLEGVGIVVASGGRGTITENAITDAAGPSLVVRGGADPNLGNNVISGGGGVVFGEGASGSLIGNQLLTAGTTGIRITTGADPRIVDNAIEGAAEAGIFVYDGGRGQIEGNAIVASGLSGVVIGAGGQPTLVGNTIRESAEHGVVVVEGGSGLLEGNQILANEGHGIALGPDTEVELVDNRLEENDAPQLLDAR